MLVFLELHMSLPLFVCVENAFSQTRSRTLSTFTRTLKCHYYSKYNIISNLIQAMYSAYSGWIF